MADKEQIDKLTKRLYRRRQLIRRHNSHTKGSKKGYYGDLEEVDGPCQSSDDESIAISSARDNTKSQHNFYSNIKPKRCCNRKRQRIKTTTSTIHHPDIDVSLVAILSSKEADRFNNHYSFHGQSVLSKSSTSSSSSECSGTSSDNTQEKITSCEHIKKKANPIAVVDYGSIHLNMDGSLLDSIYNIGDSNHHGGSTSRSRSKDLFFGGRKFSALPKDNTNKGMPAIEEDDKATLNKEIEDSTIETNRPISVITGSVLHQRTNEVSAIIASLKCNTDKKPKTRTNEKEEERAEYLMSTTPTTLEDAISFSPFARVLICAQYPFTVVHVNAAYTALVQQGLVKSFSVGQTLNSIQGGECLKEEEALTRIVSQFKTGSIIQDTRQDRITIFPVISTNDMCSQIISSYRNNLRQVQVVDNPETNMLPSVKEHGGVTNSSCSEYVSHYLLQIKPSMIGNL